MWLAADFDRVEGDLGIERLAVVAAMQPVEMLRAAVDGSAYLLQRLLIRAPAVGLVFGRETIGRLPDDLFASAGEHLQGGRIAVDELLAAPDALPDAR